MIFKSCQGLCRNQSDYRVFHRPLGHLKKKKEKKKQLNAVEVSFNPKLTNAVDLIQP